MWKVFHAHLPLFPSTANSFRRRHWRPPPPPQLMSICSCWLAKQSSNPFDHSFFSDVIAVIVCIVLRLRYSLTDLTLNSTQRRNPHINPSAYNKVGMSKRGMSRAARKLSQKGSREPIKICSVWWWLLWRRYTIILTYALTLRALVKDQGVRFEWGWTSPWDVSPITMERDQLIEGAWFFWINGICHFTYQKSRENSKTNKAKKTVFT